MKKQNRRNSVQTYKDAWLMTNMDTRMMSYLDKREKDLDLREVHMQQREDGMKQREDGMKQREDGMLQREADMAQREMRMTEREDRMTVRENQMTEREGVMDSRLKKGSAKPVLDEQGMVVLPKELQSEKAKEVLRKFQQKGMLDEHYLPFKSFPKRKVAYLASAIASETGIKNKWKLFENFWGYRDLSVSYDQQIKASNLTELTREVDDVINN